MCRTFQKNVKSSTIFYRGLVDFKKLQKALERSRLIQKTLEAGCSRKLSSDLESFRELQNVLEISRPFINIWQFSECFTMLYNVLYCFTRPWQKPLGRFRKPSNKEGSRTLWQVIRTSTKSWEDFNPCRRFQNVLGYFRKLLKVLEAYRMF